MRTRIGHFTIEEAVCDDAFEQLDAGSGYTLAEAMRHMPALEISERQARDLLNGAVPHPRGGMNQGVTLVRLLRPDGGLGAICDVGPGGTLKIRRVFKDAPSGGRRDAGDRS